MNIIYSLSAKGFGVFYIGKTKRSLQKRLYCHCADMKTYQGLNTWYKKNQILKKCAEDNIEITIDEIETISDYEEAKKSETYWICQFSVWGFNLVNINQCNSIPPQHTKKLNMISLSKTEKRIIKQKYRWGDATKISNIMGNYTDEMIRICLKGRIMREEIYNAIKKYFQF